MYTEYSRVNEGQSRSIADLVRDVAQDIRTLLRQEIALARAELGHKAAVGKRGLIAIAAGAMLAWAGLLALVGALCLALIAFGVPPWAAALTVAVVLALGGYAFIRYGISTLQPSELSPANTVESLKDSASSLKGTRP